MAWTAGHSEECTTTVPATTDGALADYTMMLSHLDFPSGDRDAIADYLAAGQYEASSASDGSSILGVLATDIDTTANTFRLWIKYTTSAVSSTDIYWRWGAAVTHNKGDQVDADWIGQWPHSEDLDDYSGSGNNGTAVGSTSAGSGGIGPGGAFASSAMDGGVDLGSSLLPGSVADLTLSGWVKTSDSSGPIYSQYIFSTTDRFLFRVQSSVVEWQHEGGNPAEATSSTSVDDNVWHHIAATRNTSGDIQIYIDGSPDGSGNSTHSILTTANTNIATGFGTLISSSALFGISLASRSPAWIATDHDRQGTLGQASSTPLATIGGGGGANIPAIMYHRRRLASAA